jgi:ferredoxin-NADP reductase
MRDTISVILFLLVAALAACCTSVDAKSAAGSKQSKTAALQLDQAKTEAKEAARAIQDYAYAQKAEFVDKMKKELLEIEVETNRLAFEVDRSSSTAKADAKAELDAVREKWARAKKQLDQAESATESTWKQVKGGFKKSHDDLKDSFDKTRQWLSDKIEP